MESIPAADIQRAPNLLAAIPHETWLPLPFLSSRGFLVHVYIKVPLTGWILPRSHRNNTVITGSFENKYADYQVWHDVVRGRGMDRIKSHI
jgi:hypothetical protein